MEEKTSSRCRFLKIYLLRSLLCTSHICLQMTVCILMEQTNVIQNNRYSVHSGQLHMHCFLGIVGRSPRPSQTPVNTLFLNYLFHNISHCSYQHDLSAALVTHQSLSISQLPLVFQCTTADFFGKALHNFTFAQELSIRASSFRKSNSYHLSGDIKKLVQTCIMYWQQK